MPIAQILFDSYKTPVFLCFFLGLWGKLLGVPPLLSRDAEKSIVFVLLFCLGFKSGLGIRDLSLVEIFQGSLMTLSLCLTLAILTFLIGQCFRLSNKDSLKLSLYFGSISIITFSTTNHFLAHSCQTKEHFFPMMALFMEWPALVFVPILFKLEKRDKIIFSLGRSPLFFFILSSMIFGYFVDSEELKNYEYAFVYPVYGIFAFFMINIGYKCVSEFQKISWKNLKLIFLVLILPVFHGLIGFCLAHFLFDFSPGGKINFAMLAASGSFVAAPRVINVLFDHEDDSLFPLIYGLAFPFNVFVVTPFFYGISWILAGSEFPTFP
jgi:hypothetical protein